jgi:hypothetical protein
MFFLSCRAVHHLLSAVAKSYSNVQRFLAKSPYRTLGELCNFDYWSSRLGMILQLFKISFRPFAALTSPFGRLSFLQVSRSYSR